MKLFGRWAGRDSSRPALSRGATGIAGGEWPRSYEAQVREGYLGNPVAQRAVKLVAEAAAGAPLTGDAAAVALVAARSGGQALVEAAATHLLLHGNAYIQMLRDGEGLRIEARVADPAVAAMVRAGALRGLSVGYRPLAVRRGRHRTLERVALVEVSLVAIPMQPLARITEFSTEEDV